MADVTVEIAGRSHRLACEDGQEAHLTALAREIDTEARALSARMSREPDEARLMLMVALVMADRARDAEARAGTPEPGADGTAEAAARIVTLAERIEAATARLSAG